MEYRKLGASGLSVSEIAFGNWITHGAQVDNDTAKACVHAALTRELLHLTPQMCIRIRRLRRCWDKS